MLSVRDQRPHAEESDQVEEATAREEVLLLSGSSAEPQAERSSEVEEGIPRRSKVEDSVAKITPRPTVWRLVFDSSRITGGEVG